MIQRMIDILEISLRQFGKFLMVDSERQYVLEMEFDADKTHEFRGLTVALIS